MIQFIQDIKEDKLRMAFNNDVIRFRLSQGVAAYCIVTMTEDVSVRLYPGPDGIFYFNFKPYIASIINTRNFEDNLQTQIQSTSANSFVYDFTDGVFLNLVVKIQAVRSDNTTDNGEYSLRWIAGVEQLREHSELSINDMLLLTPLSKQTNNHAYLKYWQGYPFDFGLYNHIEEGVNILNKTNLLSQEFYTPGTITRLFFSDGRTDETIEDVLPLIEGVNQLEIDPHSDKRFYLSVEKVAYRCGVYIKWLNKYGAYNYWLFENTAAIDRTTKQLGELYNDNENFENSFGRSIQIGKESQDVIKVITEALTEAESKIVEGIIDSPKIYLFTGQPFARNSYRDWIEVSLKTTSSRIKNYKQKLNNMAFDFELPQRYTQTL